MASRMAATSPQARPAGRRGGTAAWIPLANSLLINLSCCSGRAGPQARPAGSWPPWTVARADSARRPWRPVIMMASSRLTGPALARLTALAVTGPGTAVSTRCQLTVARPGPSDWPHPGRASDARAGLPGPDHAELPRRRRSVRPRRGWPRARRGAKPTGIRRRGRAGEARSIGPPGGSVTGTAQ